MAKSEESITTWATVTTLKESVDTTLEFVAHHLVVGADKIYLFFDDPNNPAIETVSKINWSDFYYDGIGMERGQGHRLC